MTELDEIIDRLGLDEHPEGGWYRRTWEHEQQVDGRPLASSIAFLLPRGVTTRWHRVDATELWHFHRGGPLDLSVSSDGHLVDVTSLGDDVTAGERLQVVVEGGAWQSATSRGDFTLVACVVVPAFVWEGFELAAGDWSPGRPEEPRV